MAIDIPNKTLLTPAETLALEQIAKRELRSKANLIRFAIVEHVIRPNLQVVEKNVREALEQDWDNLG